MKVSTPLVLLSSIALVAAQYKYVPQTGKFDCTRTRGLAAYCAGGNIIIRCNAGVGTAGNCNDNLANEPPYSSSVAAGCYQSSRDAGDAACTKGGLLYPASGSGASNAAPYPVPGTIVPGNGNSSSPIPYPPNSNTTTNGTISSGIWSNGTVGPVYITTHPIITVTVPCSTTPSMVVISMPNYTTSKPTKTTATTTSTSSTLTPTSSMPAQYTGAASALNGSPLLAAGVLLLGAVL